MTFQTSHEEFCFKNAKMITVIRGIGKNRTRHEFSCFIKASEHADQIGDGRSMIYAVTEAGNSAHICNR